MKKERDRKQDKRFEGKMDYRNPDSSPRCGRCRMPRHNRKNCNNPGPSNITHNQCALLLGHNAQWLCIIRHIDGLSNVIGFWYVRRHMEAANSIQSNFQAKDDDVLLASSLKLDMKWAGEEDGWVEEEEAVMGCWKGSSWTAGCWAGKEASGWVEGMWASEWAEGSWNADTSWAAVLRAEGSWAADCWVAADWVGSWAAVCWAEGGWAANGWAAGLSLTALGCCNGLIGAGLPLKLEQS
ncbi:hypothetical protein M9H77_34990 [Catharanthus roseus]|uniref:Uncharacterized protein n=1 Tax=Catharanthus roseus TaxID=4058 RepID=A0ACB9ZRD9_CATRO|nr:hypothetical protein M9H77_34990 [Catharanthus roseus]